MNTRWRRAAPWFAAGTILLIISCCVSSFSGGGLPIPGGVPVPLPVPGGPSTIPEGGPSWDWGDADDPDDYEWGGGGSDSGSWDGGGWDFGGGSDSGSWDFGGSDSGGW